jgi:hypothetical protein
VFGNIAGGEALPFDQTLFHFYEEAAWELTSAELTQTVGPIVG